MLNSPDSFTINLGEVIIGIVLSAIGWVMTTFTKRHLESMDKLAERLGTLATDVATMKSDISALRHNQESTEQRVTRLESAD